MRTQRTQSYGRRQRSSGGIRILMALGMAAFALFSYFASSQYNPVTETKQYISISEEQEIALGLQSLPAMVRQHQGEEESREIQIFLDQIGERLVQESDARQTDWQFSFTMLNDEQTINAFALPGGPTFMTMALFNDILDASSSDQQAEARVAGVMAHEIGHVVARHSAQRLAKQQLTQGLTGAAVLATYDPDNPNSQASQAAIAMIGNLVNMKYGRDDELEADRLGVRFMTQAGYDACELIGVMEILEAAGGGSRQPEFFSTHPNPDNRIREIEEAVQVETGQSCP